MVIMKKIYILLIVGVLFISGCENKKESVKEEYIATKSNLIKETNYTNKEDLPLKIVTFLDRKNEEELEYKVVLSDATRNMHDVKALVVHNYYNEDDVFPSVGLFDKKEELLVNDDKTVELTGIVRSNKSISKLDLELKIYIEYIDDSNNKKSIYYKTT